MVWIFTLQVYFPEEPRIDFVTPSIAPCDGRNVTVVGAGFFDLDKAFKCTWSTSVSFIFLVHIDVS